MGGLPKEYWYFVCFVGEKKEEMSVWEKKN
jgi:hypothetical protein